MPLGFPQVLGVVAGFTSGAVQQLPLLVVPSGDNQTGILQVGGITATVGFPFSFAADNQAPQATAGVGILGFDGTNVDRIRVSNIGVDPGSGARGALVIQGSAAGIPVPMSAPYSMQTDGQTSTTLSAYGMAAWNGTTIDRVRVTNVGADPGAGAPGAQIVQGSASGVPIPVSGSFASSQPYSGTSDAQTALTASAVALAGFNGATIDRLRVAPVGTALGQGVAGALVVQSSPNAAPFPIAAIGQGALFQVPAGTNNGVAIGSPPNGSQGVRIYIPPNCDFKYTIASGPPGSPPGQVVEFNVPPTAPYYVIVDENLSSGQNVYVTSPQILNTKLVARFI